MDEYRCPRPERRLGDSAVARDDVGGKDAFETSHPHAASSRTRYRPRSAGPWRQRRLVQHPTTPPAAPHAADDAVDGSARRPEGSPDGGEREDGRLAPQTSESGPAPCHRLDLTSMRVLLESILRNTSPTRRVARWLWATTISTSSTLAIIADDYRRRTGFIGSRAPAAADSHPGRAMPTATWRVCLASPKLSVVRPGQRNRPVGLEGAAMTATTVARPEGLGAGP